MIEVGVTIVGGGIVGCAVAAEAARHSPSVVLLEKEPRLAAGVTSRNSEVAHGGMYYPTGSLKASTCVRGRPLLKEFCARAGVAYREIGKLIARQQNPVPRPDHPAPGLLCAYRQAVQGADSGALWL